MDVDIRAVEAYARVKAVLARIDAMHCANQERQSQGLANAYGPQELFAAEGELEVIADSIKDLSMNVPKRKVIHLKTGNEYIVTGEAISSTNALDWKTMVIYERNGTVFVREAVEFWGKFMLKGGVA